MIITTITIIITVTVDSVTSLPASVTVLLKTTIYPLSPDLCLIVIKSAGARVFAGVCTFLSSFRSEIGLVSGNTSFKMCVQSPSKASPVFVYEPVFVFRAGATLMCSSKKG